MRCPSSTAVIRPGRPEANVSSGTTVLRLPARNGEHGAGLLSNCQQSSGHGEGVWAQLRGDRGRRRKQWSSCQLGLAFRALPLSNPFESLRRPNVPVTGHGVPVTTPPPSITMLRLFALTDPGSPGTPHQRGSAFMCSGRTSEANRTKRSSSHTPTKIMLAMTSVVQCTPNSTRENATPPTASAPITHAKAR